MQHLPADVIRAGTEADGLAAGERTDAPSVVVAFAGTQTAAGDRG
jgi:hypothetical protein